MEQSYPGSLLRLAAELAGAHAGKKTKNNDPPACVNAGATEGKKSVNSIPPGRKRTGIKFDTGSATRFFKLLGRTR